MTTSFDHVAELGELAVLASGCTMCVLAETRTNVVFGSGAPDADVMIVGEGPGQAEDEQGEPFVGRSGQLLASLLGEIGLQRPDVYIANVVKCRPPRNRDPRSDEIDACKGYLRRQIQLVDPLVVVTVGNFSTKLALRTDVGITRLRGVAYPWWGRYLVPTYHPAAALRGGERVTDDIRSDLRIVRSIIDGNLTEATTDDLVQEPDEGQRASIDHQLDLFGGQT
ncbi:MAG TPA: uracil-DNA glycosylase [Acidimicrobiia bacterium]|nr:uracil-DNA glycosylase [Acidimicrobiia bacterium]